MTQNLFNPFELLVGRVGAVNNGIMVPAPQLVPLFNPNFNGGGAGGGWGDCNPGGGGGCYPYPTPCPPQAPGFYAQAARTAIAAQGTQTSLGMTSRDQTPATPIGAGLPRTLTTTPTVQMCITRLAVSRTSAPFFGILSLRTARLEYLSDGQQIPADDFAPDSNTPPLQMPQVSPGTGISMIVRNNDTADHHFDAAFYGFPGPTCGPCL